MVTITAKYKRKDFFGVRTYTEDVAEFKDAERANKAASKAFKMVLADPDAAFDINAEDGEALVVWQEFSDRERDIVTVRTYHGRNCSDLLKLSRAAARKMVRAIIAGSFTGGTKTC